MAGLMDLTGWRFGRLVVAGIDRIQPCATGTRIYWKCTCDCGTDVVSRADALRIGRVVSCGCRKITHGLTKTPEFKVWSAMIERCHTESHRNYDNYGGRGISVCPEWRNDFQAFLKHVGPRPSSQHSIDRFPNNNGNYAPGNVRWATKKQQSRNTRTNVLDAAKVAEIRKSPNVWGIQTRLAKKFGCSPTTIRHVLRGATWAH